MAGLGHVEPHGAPLFEKVSATVHLTKVSVGPMDNNAYILRSVTGDLVVIDAANDAERLLNLLGGDTPSAIITTHRHGDHLQALADLFDATGATLLAGSPDVEAIERDAGVKNVRGLWDGDHIAVGDEWLEVIGLVGHTPGSITLAYSGDTRHLFTGDSLFPGGPGKTRSTEDFTSLMNDLESKIFDRFDDQTRVHPGHGDDTTLGAERPHLGEWRARGW